MSGSTCFNSSVFPVGSASGGAYCGEKARSGKVARPHQVVVGGEAFWMAGQLDSVVGLRNRTGPLICRASLLCRGPFAMSAAIHWISLQPSPLREGES